MTGGGVTGADVIGADVIDVKRSTEPSVPPLGGTSQVSLPQHDSSRCV